MLPLDAIECCFATFMIYLSDRYFLRLNFESSNCRKPPNNHKWQGAIDFCWNFRNVADIQLGFDGTDPSFLRGKRDENVTPKIQNSTLLQQCNSNSKRDKKSAKFSPWSYIFVTLSLSRHYNCEIYPKDLLLSFNKWIFNPVNASSNVRSVVLRHSRRLVPYIRPR